MSALEKGTGFEIKIAELFKSHGYHVTHNIKMTGKSGAVHQIDVMAEFQAPLHRSRVIIEAKAYSNNINKDIIMKLVQIQQDLNADRAILATTSDFSPGALQTANQYDNLELWDRKKISSHLGEMQLLDTADVMKESSSTSLEKMVQAKYTIENVRGAAESKIQERAKGGFMGRGKIVESIRGVKKFLYPYFDVDMEAKIRVTEKTGWFSKEESVQTIRSRTGIDAITGALIDIDDEGVDYYYSYLSDLDDDELQLLYYVAGVEEFEKRNLSALGWTAGKITKIVNSLTGKGVLQQTNARPAIFARVHTYPSDVASFQSIMEEHKVVNVDSSEHTFDSQISPASVSNAFGRYWSGCNVLSIDLVYYPYFIIVYEREDSTKRHEVIDGMTGHRQEYLEGIISSSVIEE